MNRIVFTSLLLLSVWCLTLPASTVADTEGPAANGSFEIMFETGHSRVVQFDARVAMDGNTTGEITFRDSGAVVTERKTVTTDEGTEALPPFYAKATCDCLLVNGVEAVLSGTVMESSRKNFIGRRVLLVVQDGDSLTPPLRDKLTFGFYRLISKPWIPADSERPDEQGPSPTWVASDSERSDDTGILSQKSGDITCQTFPLSSHSFLPAKQGKGKIQVTR